MIWSDTVQSVILVIVFVAGVIVIYLSYHKPLKVRELRTLPAICLRDHILLRCQLADNPRHLPGCPDFSGLALP
jgi:hypothetical protein